MSRVLDTAVGLVFVFALGALFCSAIVESVSTALERRAKYLITALRNMLDEAESGPGSEKGRTPGLKPAELHKAVKSYSQAKKAAAGMDTYLKAHARHTVAARRNTVVAARSRRAKRIPVPPAPEEVYGPLTATIFLHPMIRGLQTRRVMPQLDGGVRNPQYIPATTFARVLVGTFLPDGPSPDDPDAVQALRAVVAGLPERFEVRTSLLTLIDQSGDDMRTLQKSIEQWYDAQMGRVSGWYKRWTRMVLVVVGLVLAVGVNVDTFQIAHTLWVDEPVRAAVVRASADGTLCRPLAGADAESGDDAENDAAAGDGAAPGPTEQCVLDALEGLQLADVPLGHPAGCSLTADPLRTCTKTDISPADPALAGLLKLAGWAVTAGAISFGAPFWFDALSKIGSLRSSGPKPPAEETT
jgi:hypothetical protein